MSKDYYETLGVSRSSSEQDIKNAYRKMAMKYHPDKNKGDKTSEAKFKEVNEAYETLKDSQKKAAYDRYGHDAYKNAASGGYNPGAGGGFRSGGFSSSGGFEGFNFGDGSSFSEIFEEIFNATGMGGGMGGAHARERTEMRGADLRYEASITLEEAFHGKDIELNIKTGVACESCNGTGSESGAMPKVCPACRGTGQMRFSQGFFMVERTCTSCNGTGHIIEKSCRNCSGSGRVIKMRTIKVSIPAGIEDSARIRLTGEGEAGIRGGRSGDLYIFVTVRPHRLFRREGSAIHCDVPLSIVTAALGGEVEVPTIEGKKAIVKVPSGTQSGNVLKLRGKGMSIVRSSSCGDMMVHVTVETPVNLTKRQKELLREFEEENPTSYPQSDGFFAKVKEFWHEL